MASLEGQMLGQYKVIAAMGSGGMATVYKAYQERLDRFVAIKMLHEAFQEDRNFLSRFEREAKIVARLEHPHIVQVFDFDQFNGRPYLVMKYVEGRTLKAELDAMPLTIDEILRILPPIGQALDYAHRQGVLHRDIKPSNIIIDTNGTPYLTDFGLARMAQLGDSTLSNDVLLGTPHYISPEQAMGKSDLDSRTDLYSLGVVLYELVVGRVPFSADTPFAVIHDQIYRPLPKPSKTNPDLTPAIDAVLEKALAKEPTARYATAAEMIEAYRLALQGSGVAEVKRPSAPVHDVSEAKTIPPTPAPLPPRPVVPTTVLPLPEAPLEAPERYSQREAHQEERKKKRTVEASIDLSNVGTALQTAGDAVREVWQTISSNAGDRYADLDLVPMDDEIAIRKRVEAQINKRKEFYGHLIAFGVVNLALWIIFSFIQIGFPVPLVVTLGWGAGMAAHAIETMYATGRRARLRLQTIQGEFYRSYGANWEKADRKELRRIRDRVVQPITKRREFAEHLVVFICINLMLWILNTTFIQADFPWPVLVTLGWGIGLVFHAFEAVTSASHENAINRAIDRERDQLYAGDKPKRDQSYVSDSPERSSGVRLTEDGEFTDSMIDEIEADERARRKRR
jgi:serine/threonine protein kinase